MYWCEESDLLAGSIGETVNIGYSDVIFRF
jgi:hypothetical protein